MHETWHILYCPNEPTRPETSCAPYTTYCCRWQQQGKPPMMRIVRKRTSTNWGRVWRNLHATSVSEVRSAWYSVIHDIFPTHESLAAISFVDTDVCRQCDRSDTLTHRLMECEDGPAIWDWTRRHVAMMLRMDPRHIPIAWTLHPDFRLWPP